MQSIEEQLNSDDEMKKDYYDELASSIYGPHWRAKSGRNHYMDLTTIQHAKFSRLVMSIAKKNGVAATSSDLWRFTDIVCNEPHMRFVGKLCVIFGRLPRLLITIGLVMLVLFGLSFILPLVF